jgi:membrane protein YqaA with SNARE-associated domain
MKGGMKNYLLGRSCSNATQKEWNQRNRSRKRQHGGRGKKREIYSCSTMPMAHPVFISPPQLLLFGHQNKCFSKFAI